ncbi:hypothetical protein [Thiohalospira sp.]|uniref:hypothetical protein n=1 Tax=Thiohalospira sp. TaxID=3080549 RepID=UPI00397ED5D1
MATTPRRHEQAMRQSIAAEAARLMSDGALTDFHHAKRKAAARLGAGDTRNLPRNEEIEAALREHQRLFEADHQPRQLTHLRRMALEVMEAFADFRPRLVGPVLTGTAGSHTRVTLHLFSDTPEAVAFRLMDHRHPFDEGEVALRIGEAEQRLPSFRFPWGEDTEVEVVVFPERGIRQAPASPVDGHPMERAGREAVAGLLAGEGEPPA